MKKHTQIIKWATDCLISKGYSLKHVSGIVLETPWSNVIKFLTSDGYIYLKHTPPALFLEPKIMQLLASQFNASVPIVIAINNDLDCFLTKDAGQLMREYLKTELSPGLLLCQAITQFTAIQRSTENHIDSFLALGVPDWRLDKLPKLYDHITNELYFLK